MVNPDGVVSGNYRQNIQGKDMNRHFFADDDSEGYKQRALEVEILRQSLRQKFEGKMKKRFRMFVDVHSHSCAASIFMYAP